MALSFCLIRYYDLDAYHRRVMEKEKKKGLKNALGTERTVFNDEEQRRYVCICLFSLCVLVILCMFNHSHIQS